MTGNAKEMKDQIAVIGAGTMGSGIAQLAITHGHATVLVDANEASLARGLESIKKNLDRDVEKGRKTAQEASSAQSLLTTTSDIAQCKGCSIAIEAIVESLSVKEELFNKLEALLPADAILASNTSSLSIAALAGKRKSPERVVGVHFFNPATLMKLVEIVPGLLTDPIVTARCSELVTSWGKTAVHAKDTPGFIVNRVARPFYGEALRIAEEGVPYSCIDASMKELGFKMGPFELMDLIGNDINYAVTCSVFESFYYDSRYRPSILQRRMVENNLLGRKTKHGYYDYRSGDAAVLLASRPNSEVSERILAMLINEAAEAARLQIASPKEIDLAMTLGVNYPKGLLAWCDELGAAKVVTQLEALRTRYGEERYRASPRLRDLAANNAKFLN